MSTPIQALRLVLASASPRRRELLAMLGLTFACRPVDIDETPRPGEAAPDYVERLARAKARAAASNENELVVGADTIVVIDGDLLGKPGDSANAKEMLKRLSGREHQVLTAVALLTDDSMRCRVSSTKVRLALLEAADIDWYVSTGEPYDKAGAYAIQGLGALFVESISGNYTNVVGLPLPTLLQLSRDLGIDLRALA